MFGQAMNLKFKLCVLWILSGITPFVFANCQSEPDALYTAFKKYRNQINSATQLNDLTPYFSSRFKQYYTEKLANPENKSKRTRFLTHYWDNLNTAKDIIIVYEYVARCKQQRATLKLLTVLEQPRQSAAQVDLWNVTIYYVKEGASWLIDSIEYEKSNSLRTFEEQQIVDNFAVIH